MAKKERIIDQLRRIYGGHWTYEQTSLGGEWRNECMRVKAHAPLDSDLPEYREVRSGERLPISREWLF